MRALHPLPSKNDTGRCPYGRHYRFGRDGKVRLSRMFVLKLYHQWLESSGIQQGNTLLVASDVFNIALALKKEKIKFDPSLFIDALKESVGDTGTLLFPAYNYDFCKGVTFDYHNTPPQKMGTLSKIAFQRDDFIRTKHPVFSFMVASDNVEEYYDLDNISGFGADSPYALLHQKKAKMLFIDVEYNHSFTFSHYVEEMTGVDYRYLKNFTAPYIDASGTVSQRTFQLLVRDLNKGVINALNPIGEVFEQQGIAKIFTILDRKCVLLDLSEAYKIVEHDIRQNNSKNLIKILNP